MSVVLTSGFFFGTSVSSGVTIANNATQTGSEVDLFGGNTSEGWLHLFLYYTATVAVGSLDISLFYGQVTGSEAEDQSTLVGSIVPINGSQKIWLQAFQAARFMIGQVKNNALGASATNVVLGYAVTIES